MPSIKVRGLVSLIFASLALQISAQEIRIEGKWEPQSYDVSCWAASLSNLTKVHWIKPKNKINEDYFYAFFPYKIESEDFQEIAFKNFKFRGVVEQNVLNFESISHYLNYKYPRPLIYSYPYTSETEGHFYNIIGTLKIPSNDSLNNRWLEIFDPKPDSIGNRYLKNYATYQIISSSGLELNATYFNFLPKRIPFPKKLKNSTRKGIFFEDFVSSNCLDSLNLHSNFISILNYSNFNKFLGDSTIMDMKPIPIVDIYEVYTEDSSRLKQTNFVSVETKSNSDLYCSFKGSKLMGGITVQKINPGCSLIERVEKLEKYEYFSRYFQNREKAIIVLNNGYRFLRFKENGQFRNVDLDNYLKNSSLNSSYSDSVYLKEEILLNNFKISTAGTEIINLLRKMAKNEDPTCLIETSIVSPMKCIVSQIPVKNWQFPAINYNLSTDMFIKITNRTDSNEDRFMVNWGYDHSNSDPSQCPSCFPDSSRVRNPIFKNDSIVKKYAGHDYLYFVPIKAFKDFLQSNPNVSFNSNFEPYRNLAVEASSIIDIGIPRMENPKGFMGKEANSNYRNTFSPAGIVCDLIIKGSSKIEPCYVFNNRMLPDSLNIEGQIQWKD